MPIFVFECPHCRQRIERILANVERADEETIPCDSMSCPTFGTDTEATMVRVQATANFALKGAGFHVNDYPKK
jgi:predicted nucleic acid-binding Zn ribbon protein